VRRLVVLLLMPAAIALRSRTPPQAMAATPDVPAPDEAVVAAGVPRPLTPPAPPDERCSRPAPPEDEVFYPPHLKPEDQEIVERLHSIWVSVAFRDAPLFGAIDYLREITGLNFIIDVRFADPGEPVTLEANEITVREALRRMLRPTDLAHVVEGGVIVIARRERLRTQITTELYDVQDLVGVPFCEDDLVRLVREEARHDWSEERGESIQYQSGLLIVRTSRDVHARLTPLLECVRANPESWALACRR
jgi:hypothetical protein